MAYKVGTTAVVNDSAQVLSSQLSGALPALDGSSLTGTGHGTRTFMIWHNSHWSVVNGGCCLAWTVPADTERYVYFTPNLQRATSNNSAINL